MRRSQVLSNARLAGDVMRYHTWPTLQRQTVAAHTWHIMRIYYQIWGPLPPEISTFILWHDTGELRTGDPPYPVKAKNPEFKRLHDQLEQEAVRDMGGSAAELAEPLKTRAKACDLIEMLEFGHIEALMGNQFAQPIIDDMREHLKALTLTALEWDAVVRYLATKMLVTTER